MIEYLTVLCNTFLGTLGVTLPSPVIDEIDKMELKSDIPRCLNTSDFLIIFILNCHVCYPLSRQEKLDILIHLAGKL